MYWDGIDFFFPYRNWMNFGSELIKYLIWCLTWNSPVYPLKWIKLSTYTKLLSCFSGLGLFRADHLAEKYNSKHNFSLVWKENGFKWKILWLLLILFFFKQKVFCFPLWAKMQFFEGWKFRSVPVQISTLMATFAVLFAVIFHRRIISPSWIHLFLVSAWCALAITPSLGSYNLLDCLFLSEASQRKSRVKFIWSNVPTVRTDVESPDPPFPHTTSQAFLLRKPVIVWWNRGENGASRASKKAPQSRESQGNLPPKPWWRRCVVTHFSSLGGLADLHRNPWNQVN